MIIQFASCFSLLGLIWTIQLVHYPSFYSIDESFFTQFSKFHSRRISYFVVPVMLVELASGVLLVYKEPGPLVYANLFGIVAIWLVTFSISMPCHQELSEKKDELQIERLINANWVRTILWTLRSALILLIVLRGNK
jgi:hypothetical protein